MEEELITPTSIWNLDDESVISKLDEIDISKFKDGRKSFLSIATKRRKIDVVEALLQKGVNPSEGDPDVNPYFLCTFVAPNLDILNLFLATDTIPPVDEYGYTIAHMVVLKNEPDLLDAILYRFPDLLNEKTHFKYLSAASGSTPLHIAVIKKYSRCINILLKHSANLNAENDDGVAANELANAAHSGIYLRMTSLSGLFGTVAFDTSMSKPCEKASKTFFDYLNKLRKSAPQYDLNKLGILSELSKSAKKELVIEINNNLMQKIRASMKQYASLYKPATNHPFSKNSQKALGLIADNAYDADLFELATNYIRTVTEYKDKMVTADLNETEDIAADILKRCISLYCDIQSNTHVNSDFKTHRKWFFNEHVSANGKVTTRNQDLKFIYGVDEFVGDILEAYSNGVIKPLHVEFQEVTDIANAYIKNVSDLHKIE